MGIHPVFGRLSGERAALVALTLVFAGCAARNAPAVAYDAALSALPRAPMQRDGIGLRARNDTTLIFHDEFNGTTLNRKVWYTCYNWASRLGCKTSPRELEVYKPWNVTVVGGNLLLTARVQRSRYSGKSYRFTSGMIQSGGWPGNGKTPTFSFKYGYAEMRAKLPSGRIGMWPAFWLLPADNSWPPEVDIMEWQSVQPQFDNVTLWWSLPNGDRSIDYDTGVDLSAGYHTYGLDWQRNYMDFYFDRRRVMHYTGPHVPRKAMFVLINLAIGGWARGQSNPPASEFPTTYAIDYVRVWNRRPWQS